MLYSGIPSRQYFPANYSHTLRIRLLIHCYRLLFLQSKYYPYIFAYPNVSVSLLVSVSVSAAVFVAKQMAKFDTMKVTRCPLHWHKCLYKLRPPIPNRCKYQTEPKQNWSDNRKVINIRGCVLHCLANKLRLAKSMGRKCASVSCHCHETGRQQGHPSPDLGIAIATARGPLPSRKLPPWPQAAATASERRTKNDYGTLCKWAGKLQLTCLLAGNQSGKPRITVTTQNRKNKKIYT